MALPAIPTAEELQALVADLTSVATNYSATPDLKGYISRVQIIEKAKRIAQSLIPPDQLPNYHGLNVRLLNRYLTSRHQQGYLDGRGNRHPHLHKA
jgi:hypothetical protein